MSLSDGLLDWQSMCMQACISKCVRVSHFEWKSVKFLQYEIKVFRMTMSYMASNGEAFPDFIYIWSV